MLAVVSLILALTVTFLAITIREQALAQSRQDVILEYEQVRKSAVPHERNEKNRRFNDKSSPASRKIREFPNGVENLPTNVHWWTGVSALPVETAEAVVIGTVTKREAHLSEDATNIYTEYRVGIEQVLKDTDGTLSTKENVSLVRYGGNVRFNSGKIQKYSPIYYGVPQEKGRYVFFLKRENGVDWFILTGYQFSGKKVVPLDWQESNDAREELPFNKYLNAEEDDLIQDIRAAMKADQRKGEN